MRFGIQTILWGHRPADYRRMFDIIEDAGFEGVEFFQHPDNLPPFAELFQLLRDRQRPLVLLGLAGGDLNSRKKYLHGKVDPKCLPQGWTPKDPYLCNDEWSPLVEELMADHYRLAVHPHYLKEINSAKDAFQRLKDNHRLLYIPDTAHAEIKRENVLEGIKTYCDRLAAVHLKDWRPGFGRASALYSRGFTELGRGTVKLEPVLDYLRNHIKYEGWVVVEQDYTEGLPETSVQAAASWLKDRHYLEAVPNLTPRPLQEQQIRGSARITLTAVDQFLSQHLASRTVGQLYQTMADTLRDSFALSAIAVWSCSETERILTLQGLSPAPKAEAPELTVAYEKLVEPINVRSLGSEQVHTAVRRALADVDLNHEVLRLPVPFTWSPHHTRIVVDLFSSSMRDFDRDGRVLLAQSIARVFDSHMDRLAFSSAADLNLAATSALDEEDYCRKLKELVKDRLQCEAVALFLTDRSGMRLKPFVSPELIWRQDLHESEQYYEIGDGQLTTHIWQKSEPHFLNRAGGRSARAKPPKCVLRLQHNEHDRVLSMPIVDTNGVSTGLVRCANKITPSGNVCNFSDDDLVVLDHLVQQAIPTLRLLNATKEEQQRLLIVAHELKSPAAALCTETDLMLADLQNEKVRAQIPVTLRRRISSAYRWSENLRSLVLRSRYLSGRPEKQFFVVPQRTMLLGDIIAPTIAQLRWDLSERGLDPKSMRYDYNKFLQTIPSLFVDRNMFQQVFFNLLDNAIKYSKRDPRQFSVKIVSADEGAFFSIRVIDNGKGIPKDMTRLFQMGCRGPESFRSAEGAGVGLWLVRELLNLHGGKIEVENFSEPTILRISLPRNLASENWRV